MAVSSSNTIIIDVTLNAQDATQRAKALSETIIALKDRQEVLKSSGRSLGLEYRSNAAEIQKLERQTRAYLNIANQQTGSLNQLRAQLSLLTSQFDGLSRAERENAAIGGNLTSQIQKLQKEISAAEQATGRFQRNVGNYTQGLQNYVSGFFSLASAIALVKKTFDTALETDAFRVATGYILESSELADVKIRGLKDSANKLGLEFVNAGESYQKFIGAAKASDFDLQQADKVFQSISRVLGVLHVPAEGAGRAFYALQEMISMGTVQSRQLNRMLGLVIPGSTKIMADALGVTVQQLHEMQKAGELITSEVLPKFADQLDKAIAPGVEQIDSLQASFSNLKNTFSESVDANSGIQRFFKTIIDGLSQISGIILGTFNDVTMGRWDAFMARLTNNDTANRIVKLGESLTNSLKVINEFTSVDNLSPEQVNRAGTVLTDVYKDAKKAYDDYSKGVADGTLKDTGNLMEYKNAADLIYSKLNQIKMLYPNMGKEVKKVVELSDEQLTSVKQIRDRISDLQKLPGSAVADDGIFKRIKALQDRLKSLRTNSNKEEENALKRIAEDRIKSELATAQRLMTAREIEYQNINADIDKRKKIYVKYGQDTTQIELERQTRLNELSVKFHQADLQVIRQNLNEAAQLRISLLTDGSDKAFQLAQLQNQQAIDQADRNILALASRIALGEQGLNEVINSEASKRAELLNQGNQQRLEQASELALRLSEIERAGFGELARLEGEDLQRQQDIVAQRIQTNDQLTQSYSDLVGAIGGLTEKQTALGKIAFLAQKAFAIQQIILNAELTKSQIILRYEVLKLQATQAAALAGPFAPFVAAAAVAGLSAAEAVEIGKATAQEVVQVAIVGATALSGVIGKAKGGVQGYTSDGKGGVLKGYAKKDDTNAYLRSGEAVVVSEAARDPQTRKLLSDINVAYGGNPYPGLALGGIYGGSSLQATNNNITNQLFQQNQLNEAISRIKIYTAITEVRAADANYTKLVDNATF